MNYLCVTITLILCAISHVLCLTKVPCILSDDDCVNKGVKMAYLGVVSGNPAIGLPTLEPIHVDLIEAVTPTLNYTLSDAYLHGMKDCSPKKLQFLLNNSSWSLHLICPHLEVESNYYIYGDIDKTHLEGEGKCKLIYDDYHIAILAKYEKYNNTEGNIRIKTKSFSLQTLDIQGGIRYQMENLSNGGDKKYDSMPTDWEKTLDTTIQKSMMNLFMDKFVDNTNIYVKDLNINDIFFKTE